MFWMVFTQNFQSQIVQIIVQIMENASTTPAFVKTIGVEETAPRPSARIIAVSLGSAVRKDVSAIMVTRDSHVRYTEHIPKATSTL